MVDLGLAAGSGSESHRHRVSDQQSSTLSQATAYLLLGMALGAWLVVALVVGLQAFASVPTLVAPVELAPGGVAAGRSFDSTMTTSTGLVAPR